MLAMPPAMIGVCNTISLLPFRCSTLVMEVPLVVAATAALSVLELAAKKFAGAESVPLGSAITAAAAGARLFVGSWAEQLKIKKVKLKMRAAAASWRPVWDFHFAFFILNF